MLYFVVWIAVNSSKRGSWSYRTKVCLIASTSYANQQESYLVGLTVKVVCVIKKKKSRG